MITRHISQYLLIATLSLIGARSASAQAPAVGSISEDVSFATWNAERKLENHKLSEYANKVVVLFYYTPW